MTICAVLQGTKAVQDRLVIAADPVWGKLIDSSIIVRAAQLGGPVEVACAVGREARRRTSPSIQFG